MDAAPEVSAARKTFRTASSILRDSVRDMKRQEEPADLVVPTRIVAC